MSRRKRFVLVVLAVLLLALIVPPYITLNRLKSRLAGTLGSGLGRPVTIGGITLRLLPQPGFELTNFVVADDPAFSAEPMLRADSVTASLRLTSLWRGRLEIAKLSLDTPTLNLVRGPSGQWNLPSLLRRARAASVAPTTRRSPEARPRFPYVEASGGRINFKIGNEKKVWAIADADFAFWLESEEEWRMRLEGRPVRTDLNLSADTGTLKLEGRFQRGALPADAALHFSGELAESQVRELVRFITGADHGWAGRLTTDFSIAGTASKLQLSDDTRLEDFRRYDIMGGEIMRFRSQCAAQYDTASETLGAIDCSLPLGNGRITARGDVQHLFAARAYDLTFGAEQVPAGQLVAMVRHAKKDMAGDLAASGQVDAFFYMRGTGDAILYTGQGTASSVTLRSASLSSPIALGNLAFGFAPPPLPPHPRRRRNTHLAPVSQLPFTVTPFQADLGSRKPVTFGAQATPQGYAVALGGSAALPRLLEVARALGLRPPELRAHGDVSLDLTASSPWTGFQPPVFVGAMTLHQVTANLAGVAAPLLVRDADVTLSASAVRASNVAASFDGSNLTGSAWLPRGCAHIGDCTVGFSMRVDRLNLDTWNRLLNPRLQPHPWYEVVTGAPRIASVPARLRAQGDFTIEKLTLKRLVSINVTGNASYAGRRLIVTELRTPFLLGGQVTGGTLRADFAADPPSYQLNGRLDRASVQQIAALSRAAWGTGTVGGRFGLTFSGWNAAEMLSSAQGAAQFDWRGGALRQVLLDGRAPLQVHRFSGDLRLNDRRFAISNATLVAPRSTYAVSGSAGFDRRLSFTLNAVTGPTYTVDGTFDAPRVRAVKSAPQTASKQP